MEYTLKPCPFCGGSVEFTNYGEMTDDMDIQCTNCGIIVSYYRVTTREEAVRVWNNRVESMMEDDRK